MKTFVLTFSTTLCLLLAALLSTMPPQKGNGQPRSRVDTFIAPPATIVKIDTSELFETSERLSKKADVLVDKLKVVNETGDQMKKEAKSLQRNTRKMMNAAYYDVNNAEPLNYAEGYECGQICPIPALTTIDSDSLHQEPKRNFLQRVKYLFHPKGN